MNERIRELAEQTGLSKAKYWMNNAGEIHFEKLVSLQDDHTEEVKKFAELIVGQILEITDAHTEVFQTDRDRALIDHIKQSVKQHFGVEE